MAELITFYRPSKKAPAKVEPKPEPEEWERTTALEILQNASEVPDLDEVVVVMRSKGGLPMLLSNCDSVAHVEQLMNRMLWYIAKNEDDDYDPDESA